MRLAKKGQYISGAMSSINNEVGEFLFKIMLYNVVESKGKGKDEQK